MISPANKDEVLETTLSALQASISVLLVLGYGALAAQYKFMSIEGEKNIAHLGVTLFLPALLFSEIGPQASASNLVKDWIIIALAVWFQIISFVAAVVLRKIFKLPQWLVPCLVFNNVTSLPLLMFSSLKTQGALDEFVGKNETIDSLLSRARSYILVNALVCNLTRFLFGPMLMLPKSQIDHIFTHFETPHLPRQLQSADYAEDSVQETSLQPDDAERQPLLHHRQSIHDAEAPHPEGPKSSGHSQPLLYKIWSGFKSVLNPPLIGGLVAIIVGVIPFLHKLFLSENSPIAAFTVSIAGVGELYTTLQIFVLGGQLYSKRGSEAHIGTFAVILVWRFFAMPVVSISTLYLLRKVFSHEVFHPDPVLISRNNGKDFVLAIVPVGPPAITLAAVAELSGMSSEMEGCVDRTLMYSYIVTPIVSLPVTAALIVVRKLHGIK